MLFSLIFLILCLKKIALSYSTMNVISNSINFFFSCLYKSKMEMFLATRNAKKIFKTVVSKFIG